MVIKVKREFLEALLDRAATVSGGTVQSFLRTFLIETSDGELTIVRTDTVLAAVARTKCYETDTEASQYRILVDSDKFYQLIKSFSGEVVEIEDVGNHLLRISCGNYVGSWKNEDISKFPSLPSFSQKENRIRVSAKDFVQAIERVKYAGATKTFNFAFRQIYFDKGFCWATDGSRYQDVVCKAVNFPIVLPLIAVDVARFIRLTGAENLDIERDESNFYFRVGEDLYICKNPSVSPPINPKDTYFKSSGVNKRPGWFVFEVGRLKEIVRRIGITSTIGDSRISFHVKSSEIVLSGVDDVGNKSQESMLITFQGDSQAMKKFDVQWDYMEEALSAVKVASAEFVIGESHIALRSDDSFGILPMLKERNE